jgi:hypothetical protein
MRLPHQLKGAAQELIDTHDSAIVVKLTTIVWGREEGDEGAVVEELVAVLYDRVPATDEIEAVLFQELVERRLASLSLEDDGMFLRC